MGILEAIVLGIVQGLTEFLPVSSTAHLRIVPALLGWDDPGAAFTAVTQIGTLVAVLIYFRDDILKLTIAWIESLLSRQPWKTPESTQAWYIAFGTIPIVFFGLLLKSFIESEFRSLYVIAGTLIALALLFVVAEKDSTLNRDLKSLTMGETVIIGFAQAIALIPGSSRSGTTITAGLFLNLNREAAARFSFLLSIPAVALSGLYQLYKMHRDVMSGEIGLPLIVATVVAGIVGWWSIDVLLKYLRTHSTWVFIVYRIALGILLIVLIGMQVVQP